VWIGAFNVLFITDAMRIWTMPRVSIFLTNLEVYRLQILSELMREILTKKVKDLSEKTLYFTLQFLLTDFRSVRQKLCEEYFLFFVVNVIIRRIASNYFLLCVIFVRHTYYLHWESVSTSTIVTVRAKKTVPDGYVFTSILKCKQTISKSTGSS
jgi:hypothetical protein